MHPGPDTYIPCTGCTYAYEYVYVAFVLEATYPLNVAIVRSQFCRETISKSLVVCVVKSVTEL
jgi:hypothetical protein